MMDIQPPKTVDELAIWMALVIAGFACIAVGWVLNKSNRTKLWRMITKRNFGLINIIGKGMFLNQVMVDLTEDIMIFGKKLYRIRTRDENKQPLFYWVHGVPWILYNEDVVSPLVPMSKTENIWWCGNCRKEIAKPNIRKEGKTEIMECPTCESQLEERQVILPVNPHAINSEVKMGQTSSLYHLFTLMKKEARLEAESELLKQIKYIFYIVIAIAILVIIAIALTHTGHENILKQVEVWKNATAAAANATASAMPRP
jgi:hypothetical protein